MDHFEYVEKERKGTLRMVVSSECYNRKRKTNNRRKKKEKKKLCKCRTNEQRNIRESGRKKKKEKESKLLSENEKVGEKII